MQAIRNLCTRALLLKEGRLVADGPVSSILQRYASEQATSLDLQFRALTNRLNRARGYARISKFSIVNKSGLNTARWVVRAGDSVEFRIAYEIYEPVNALAVSVSLSLPGGGEMLTSMRKLIRTNLRVGDSGEIALQIPRLPLAPGEFAINLALGNDDFSIIDDLVDANAHLPHLTVESANEAAAVATGLFSVDHVFQHIDPVDTK